MNNDNIVNKLDGVNGEAEEIDEEFSPFDNKGSIGYLEQFERKLNEFNRVLVGGFWALIFLIAVARIFNLISTTEAVIDLLLVAVNWRLFSVVAGWILVDNWYCQAKSHALVDQISLRRHKHSASS